MTGARLGTALGLSLVLVLSACGDNSEGDPDADVSIDAGPRPDADSTDARPGAPDGATFDAVALDGGPDATPDLLPDLEPDAVTRDGAYYRVVVCNVGLGNDPGMFSVRLAHLGTGDAFETGVVFEVPVPGECVQTGGITCGLIGDADCDLAGNVLAFVDSGEDVVEADETNNTLVVTL